MAKILFITTYNPGVIGPRYIGAYLKQKGHEVWLVHFKELRFHTMKTQEWDKHREIREGPVQFVYFQRPGFRLYSPYPTVITDCERELLLKTIEEIPENPDKEDDILSVWSGYYMIVGSFENIQYAEKYVQKLRDMGYNSQIIESNKGFYRV